MNTQIGINSASKLKKACAVVLAVSTAIWAIGIATLAPVLVGTVEAAAMTAHPNGVLVDIGDANHTVYLISGGTRLGIPSPTVFASHGYTFAKVVAANDYDKALPAGSVMTYADSTLVKVGQEISLIGNGQKRGFATEAAFKGLGYDFTKSNIVTPEAGYLSTFTGYTTGTPITSATEAHPNGSLVNVSGTVYQISDGHLVGVPSPAVFASQGLNWSNVVTANTADKALTVSASIMKFADGTLVKDTTDGRTVYVISDGQKLGVTTPEALAAYGYAWGNVVDGDVSSYTAGTVISDTTVIPTTGTNAVSLSTDTPAAGVVARGAQDVVFAKYTFTADSAGYTISSMSVTRGGYAADSDVTAVKLFNGSTQLGSTQALNTNTHKAGFTGLNVAVPANGSVTLTVKGNLLATAGIGNSVQLGISAAADVTATATLAGTFPMYGNARTVATVAVGVLDVDVRTTPAAAIVLSGSTEQAIASWTFAATATEGFNINSIKLTNVGSAGDADFSNIKLKYNATELATATSMTGSAATFTLAAPLEIKASQTKTITAYANISAGITTQRTLQFEITRAEDISATGMNSGGNVTATKATGGSGTAFTRQTGLVMIAGQGSLTTSLDTASNPSAQAYVLGTENNLMTTLKFSAGSREGARVTQLTLTLAGTNAASTDISNVCLYDASDVAIGSCGSIIGTTVQFGTNTINAYDATGLFDVAATENKVIKVKADVPTGASTSHTISLSVANAGDVRADGLVSQNDVPAASITGTATGTAHTISAHGTLTLTTAGDSASAATISKGIQNVAIAKFDMTASAGEDILVGSIKVSFAKDATGDTTAFEDLVAGDITNVDFYDGTTLLGTVASPITDATLAVNLTVAKSTTKSISIYADIPSTTTAGYVTARLHAATDVDTTGSSSTDTDVATGTPAGSVMTISTGSLTAIMSASPIYASVTANATDLIVGNLVLTAGTAEDINISQVVIKETGTIVDATITALKLFDGATQLGDSKTLTTTKATFSGTNFPVKITKGTSKTLVIKASLNSSSTGYIQVGVDNYVSDISATGVSSSATIYANHLTTVTADQSIDISETDVTAELASLAGTAIGDVMTIGTEDILLVTANGSTVVRGFNNTTAAVHAAASEVVRKSSTKVLASANGITAASVTTIDFTTTVSGTIAEGDMITWYDPDVAASADDMKLVTAINTTSFLVTNVDTYAGTDSDGEVADVDGIVVVHDNYGQAMAIVAVGTMTVDVDSANPVAAQVIAGTSGVEFTKIKFAASFEDIKISKLVLTQDGGRSADFSAVKLTYKDSTGATKTASEPITGTTVTFNLPAGSEIYVTKDGNQTVTVSADVNTAAAGAVSADAVKFGIANAETGSLASAITAAGASTGTTLVDAKFTSPTLEPIITNVTAKTIYKTKLTVAKSASSPLSGSLTQSTAMKLAQFTLTNASNAANQEASFTSFKIKLNRTNVTADNFKLYRADTNAQLGSTVISPATTSDTVTFTIASNNTIAAGGTLDVYVKSDVHFQGANATSTLAGNMQAVINNLASGGDITWSDGVTTSITWVDVANTTSIEDTGMFTYSGGSDSYLPYLVAVVAANVGTAAKVDATDTVKFVYSEPMKTSVAPVGAAANDITGNAGTDTISVNVAAGTGASLGIMTFATSVTVTANSTAASTYAQATTVQTNDSWTCTIGTGTDLAVVGAISVVADITKGAVQDAQGNALSNVTTAVTATGTF